jgi:hypothetical protein
MAKKYINISATTDIGFCIQYTGVLQGTPLHLYSYLSYCITILYSTTLLDLLTFTCFPLS